ncbi:PREDICTED: fibrillin-1 [Nicrophorus vespilloides]|uniref:Fibrillin-1 n=1 Tax=Nicrophorus vespilloides TaxID=110193 RepID=A0ABM1MKN7_NICVS|nr:PREDICTED: fibrillin-1 [Nicrophorus vespilloides]
MRRKIYSLTIAFGFFLMSIQATSGLEAGKKIKISTPGLEEIPTNLLNLLDTSCARRKITEAPRIDHMENVKYSKRKRAKKTFLIATYSCQDGYSLLNDNRKLYCGNGKWMGPWPICIPNAGLAYTQSDDSNVVTTTGLNECPQDFAKRCQHDCVMSNGKPKCNCYNGFQMNNGVCEDINECLTNNGNCAHECTNSPGSFQCTCPPGFFVSEYSCVDINECTLRNGHGPCQETCENTEGSYRCSCQLPGTQLAPDLHTCVDLDECQQGTSGCSHGCINTHGNTFCTCPEGMMLDTDWKTCTDINECEDSPCSHECVNIVGSYKCACPTGYLIGPENLHECVDVNECESKPCSHLCENTVGSFVCSCPDTWILKNNTCVQDNCPPGYKMENDGCEDINECLDGVCDGLCENTNGSYECSCYEGYYLNETTRACVDIDECIDEYSNDCDQLCLNTPGSYSCECQEGFSLIEGICTDVNECLDFNGNCTHLCANLEGSYQCACDIGYVLQEDNRTCKELDLCTDNNGGCSHVCENYNGSVICGCPDGYELYDKDCFKISPCKINNGGCSHFCEHINNTVNCLCPDNHKLINTSFCEIDACFEENGGCSHMCENIKGQASCSCPDETYELKGKICYKINLCLINNGGCSHGCQFNNNEVVCDCPPYHELNDKQCKKINPCEIDNGGCSHLCDFFNDQINCACPKGFELVGKECERYDPCSVNNGGCSHDCFNNNGDVECLCPIRYELIDGKNCAPIDPCADRNGGCSHYCSSTTGFARCHCPEGFQLVDKTCVKIDPCKLLNCSHFCINQNEYAQCYCPDNLLLVNNTCVDPCEGFGCSHSCRSVRGVPFCECPDHLMLSDKTCIDIDPCLTKNCSHDCVLVNKQAVCKCPDNYELQDSICKPVNPCTINNGGCSHICYSYRGFAKCSCPDGFVSQGKKCLDENPCRANNGNCSHICTNGNGVSTCSCPTGYTLRPNKRTCKDINECLIENGKCSHYCKNTPGGRTCLCPKGYQLHEDQSQCTKISCFYNNGGCQQICKNSYGSIKCGCTEGFTLQEDKKSCKKAQFSECPLKIPINGRIKCTNQNNSSYVPVNTQCLVTCDRGYKLMGESIRTCKSSGNWDRDDAYCVGVSCKKMPHPLNGRFIPTSCTSGKNFIGEKCKLHCRIGYKPNPNMELFTCLPNSQWTPDIEDNHIVNACVQEYYHVEPSIRCPNGGSLNFDLPKGKNSVMVQIPKPESNVDWWRFVKATPSWAKQLYSNLGPGRFEVIFNAYSPTLNTSSSCHLLINVRDTEAPQMTGCPANMEITLRKDERTRTVYWQEPIFTDNVGVKTVYKSKESSSSLGPGYHHVNYIASDNAGNRAFCHFTISIKEFGYTFNYPGRYRAVLICPHGIQYMSNSPDNYDNSITTRNGCHWSHIRVREPMGNAAYRLPSFRTHHSQHGSNHNSHAYRDKLKRNLFDWNKNCC